MSDLKNLTISQTILGLKNQQFSCLELVDYYLAQIDKQKNLNCFITVAAESARVQAKAVDQKIQAGERLGGLEGVPVAVKDIILTKGLKTTAGSKILANYIAPYDATVISKLKHQGAVILGKTNNDEFAMGSSNETSAYGPVLNPWDHSRVPGGSSGGSAAAVAADECVFALGTDTGGSIRQPAAFCGTVGLKPTYGRVSRYGLIAMTSSLDQAGPITKTVEDSALVLQAISGADGYDATASNQPVENYLSALRQDIKGLKIGVPSNYFSSGLDAEVKLAVETAIKKIESLGAKIIPVNLKHDAYALAVYYIIMPAEVSSNLARYDAVRYGVASEVAQDLWQAYVKSRSQGFGPEVKRRIMIGTYALSRGYQEEFYQKAKAVQQIIKQEYLDIFNQVDAIITPTTPTAAFKLGEKSGDPLTMYLSDIFTVAANIAGLCGLSIPAGFSKSGLPIGLQLLGAPFNEAKILKIGYNYQQATDWHNQHPY